jgi:ribonucleotide monophosphatase NagD (HAD superfamily)
MLHAALTGLDVDLDDCVMVGDRLSTDIRMGLNTGTATALVLTGEAKVEDLNALLASDLPDLVLDRIDRLLPRQVWKELNWREEP